MGLNALEAEVYAQLLKESPLTGYGVAKALGKPAANVYKAIDTLADKGAVIVDEGGTRQCRAVPAQGFPRSPRARLQTSPQVGRRRRWPNLANRRRTTAFISCAAASRFSSNAASCCATQNALCMPMYSRARCSNSKQSWRQQRSAASLCSSKPTLPAEIEGVEVLVEPGLANSSSIAGRDSGLMSPLTGRTTAWRCCRRTVTRSCKRCGLRVRICHISTTRVLRTRSLTRD